MSDFIDFLEQLPPFLWFGIAAFLVWRYRRSVEALLARFTAFKGMGVELEFAGQALNKAVADNPSFTTPDKTIEGAMQQTRSFAPVEITAKDKRQALDRAVEKRALLQGAQILWVDDVPRNNLNERIMFRRLGVASTAVTSTAKAIEVLEIDEPLYDVIISDIKRDDDPAAGLVLLRQHKDRNGTLPIIFYVGHKDIGKSLPAGAFGLTNRPDELLNLVIDALEEAVMKS